MHLRASSLLLTLWAVCSSALHESDVGIVDWHKRLIGVPNTETIHTSPVFHQVSEQISVIITATGSNVLAGVDPVDGSVAWRHVYEPQDNIATFKKHQSVVASLSGPGGASLRSFDVLNGDLLLEKQLHEPDTGLLIQPSSLGTFIAFGNSTQDIYTLTNARVVSFISNGETSWTSVFEDADSAVLFSTLYVANDAIYVIGLASSFASYTVHVSVLSPTTGQVLTSSTIPSSISNGINDFLVVSDIVVWLETGVLKSFVLSPSLSGRPRVLKSASYEMLVDIGLGSHGMFVASRQDGTGQLLSCETGNVVSIKDFKRPSNTKALYAGGFDKNGRPYASLLYSSPSLELAAVEIFSPHLAEGKGLATKYSLSFERNTHGTIYHFAMDYTNPSSSLILGRLFLTTSTGAIQIWEQDKHIWTREEGLAEVNNVRFVELPERRSVLTGEGRAEEGFVGRLLRQIKDAKDLPDYIIRFAKRFATGSYESATSSAAVSPPSSSAPQLLFRDTFGFRQVLVVSTVYGKVYGIDTSNGDILWSRLLGTGRLDNQEDARTYPREGKMYVMKTVGDADEDALETGPEIALFADCLTQQVDTSDASLFYFNALTGEDAVADQKSNDKPLEGILAAAGPITDAYLLQSDGKKVLVVLDSNLQPLLYPNDIISKEIFVNATAKSLSVPLHLLTPHGQRVLVGHQFLSTPSADGDEGPHSVFPTWTLSLPEGQDVQSIIKPIQDPVASIGKVLGNRTTLYKYLNPHVVLVLTAPPAYTTSTPHCGLYLVDSVKGTVVYQAILPTEAGACNVKATFTENWLVYHYYDDEYQGSGQAKGYRMVSVELYEGKQIDDKTRSSELSSYSEKMMDITAYEQSFIYPHAISAITLTSTKFGITSKDVVVANANGKIQSISRRLLNPRRPVDRKPSTEEQEEFLMQYDPVLGDDSRKVLSHNYDVAHTRLIVTSPALLESTSLVFACGLDLFLTRVAPSNTFDVLNESFNKVQLVLTVSGLAAAIFITRPMVMRKKLREKWYQ